MRIELQARREALEPARLALDAFLAPYEPSPKLVYGAELVLEEVLMNIAWHAYGDRQDRPVTVQAQVQDDALVLRFEDAGIAFDPTHAAEPARPEDIEHAQVGGLGLALVRKAARSLRYERRAGLNCLEVTLPR